MSQYVISDSEFAYVRKLIHEIAGISLADSKKMLVCSRLGKRLAHHGLSNFREYFQRIASGQLDNELQVAVDLLTTNETYFFREPRHFDFLRDRILPELKGRQIRVWSAACSSGEEPYSLAMLLADQLGDSGWEVLASDLSSRVLERARRGHYSMERTQHIPKPYLRRFCLKGVGAQDGTLLVDRTLRRHVTFRQVNLNGPLPSVGIFDVIFLRNVLIYFDLETKTRVVARLAKHLRPGGYLIVGHSESLSHLPEGMFVVQPSVYRMRDD